jgi:hypothetical protein
VVELLQLLGEALGVGGRNENAVDAIGDDVAVAGDLRRDDGGAGGERLDEDHPEALAGQRGGAEYVGVAEPLPQLPVGELADGVDPGADLGVGQERGDLVAARADDGQS